MHVACGGRLRLSFERRDRPLIRYSAQNVLLAGDGPIGRVIRAAVEVMVETDEIFAIRRKDMERELPRCGASVGYKGLDLAKETTNDKRDNLTLVDEMVDSCLSFVYTE